MRRVLPILTGITLVVAAFFAAIPVAWSGDDDSSDEDESLVVWEPRIESVGVNFASASDEARMASDIHEKVSSRANLLASCYALHASKEDDPDEVVTVDWTITTSGEPLGFSVFTSIDSLKPCIRRTLSDLEFAHLDDAHPRARVKLRFSE